MKNGCDTIGEVHRFLRSEMERKKKNKPSISNKVRQFVLDYAKGVYDTKLAVFVLYHAYERITGNTIKKSYFEKILLKTWNSEVDEYGVLHIDTSAPLNDDIYVRRIL